MLITSISFLPGRVFSMLTTALPALPESKHQSSMRVLSSLVAILVFSLTVHTQSGRRAQESKTPAPSSGQQSNEATTKPTADDPPPVRAERNQDYRCSEDGSLETILETDDLGEVVVSAKDADQQAVITAKPKPSYTREARRKSVQGFVTVRVLLSARGKIGRVRVLKGLPA